MGDGLWEGFDFVEYDFSISAVFVDFAGAEASVELKSGRKGAVGCVGVGFIAGDRLVNGRIEL